MFEAPDAPAAPGRSMGECDPISGDNIERTVTWGGESDLSGLRRRRVRFYMRQERLYSLRIA